MSKVVLWLRKICEENKEKNMKKKKIVLKECITLNTIDTIKIKGGFTATDDLWKWRKN